MTNIEISLNNYCSNYETMAKEIQEGIDEGVNEGLKEGVKQGFVAGIRDCRLSGFDNIHIKSMEEILKDAFRTASDEGIIFTVRRTATSEYRKKISPSFKKKMEEACNKAVEEIKKYDFKLEKNSASELKNRVDTSIKKIRERIKGVCGGMKKNLPSDLIFENFFSCLQDEFNKDLDENLEVCKRRICKEIDSKIENKKAGNEQN